MYKIWEFHKKLCKRVTVEGQIYGQNFKILTVLGAVFAHFCPYKCEIWRQISRLSGQRVAPVGQKPIFGPLSKNNTGMAALCAGLPVIKHRKAEYSRIHQSVGNIFHQQKRVPVGVISHENVWHTQNGPHCYDLPGHSVRGAGAVTAARRHAQRSVKAWCTACKNDKCKRNEYFETLWQPKHVSTAWTLCLLYNSSTQYVYCIRNHFSQIGPTGLQVVIL